MPYTVENQKVIRIHKPKYGYDFLQVANKEWMTVNKTLSPYGLQLYLFLAGNADNFEVALSPEAAEQMAGIRSTTFYKYLRLLEEAGYLVWRKGNCFDFYTSPRPAEERTHPDEHSDGINFKKAVPSNENPSSPCEENFLQNEPPVPQNEGNFPPADIEIDNIYGQIETDKQIRGGTQGVPPPRAEAEKKWEYRF